MEQNRNSGSLSQSPVKNQKPGDFDPVLFRFPLPSLLLLMLASLSKKSPSMQKAWQPVREIAQRCTEGVCVSCLAATLTPSFYPCFHAIEITQILKRAV
jgi:hypothetical protein